MVMFFGGVLKQLVGGGRVWPFAVRRSDKWSPELAASLQRRFTESLGAQFGVKGFHKGFGFRVPGFWGRSASWTCTWRFRAGWVWRLWGSDSVAILGSVGGHSQH